LGDRPSDTDRDKTKIRRARRARGISCVVGSQIRISGELRMDQVRPWHKEVSIEGRCLGLVVLLWIVSMWMVLSAMGVHGVDKASDDEFLKRLKETFLTSSSSSARLNGNNEKTQEKSASHRKAAERTVTCIVDARRPKKDSLSIEDELQSACSRASLFDSNQLNSMGEYFLTKSNMLVSKSCFVRACNRSLLSSASKESIVDHGTTLTVSISLRTERITITIVNALRGIAKSNHMFASTGSFSLATPRWKDKKKQFLSESQRILLYLINTSTNTTHVETKHDHYVPH